MFEFFCEKVIPGCTHTETGGSEDEVRRKAEAHLRDHHHLHYLDDDLLDRVNLAIIGMR